METVRALLVFAFLFAATTTDAKSVEVPPTSGVQMTWAQVAQPMGPPPRDWTIKSKTPYDELLWGVDFFMGDKALPQDTHKSVNVRARLGDNLTTVTREALRPYLAMKSKMDEHVISLLRDAGGIRCDACKTVVEEFHKYMQSIMQHGKMINLDEEGENLVVKEVCLSKRGRSFNEKVQAICKEMLGGKYRAELLQRWKSVSMTREAMPNQLARVCRGLYNICPGHAVSSQPKPSKCRVCMEIFQTLDFLIRRDSVTIQMEGKNRRGFREARHVGARLGEVCAALPLHFTGRVLEKLEEACEDLIEENSEEAKDYFKPSVRVPATVCINAIKSCTKKEFSGEFPSLHHAPMNFTNCEYSQPKKTTNPPLPVPKPSAIPSVATQRPSLQPGEGPKKDL